MTVIILTLTESTNQVISGIPHSITLTTDAPSSIFYTLDGTTPDVSSSIYVGAITLPTNNSSVIFKAFATDGVNSSAVLSKTYSPNISGIRQSHSQITSNNIPSAPITPFPFSDKTGSPPFSYGEIGGGLIVDDPEVIGIPDGYDGSGSNKYSDQTDKPLNEYKIIYSDTNDKGERGPNLGTVPNKVTIKNNNPPGPISTFSAASDHFFNPKALVIYQDSRLVPDDGIARFNHQFFTLPHAESNGPSQRAVEGNHTTGSFIRSDHNPNDQTITYSYRDSFTNRWIFSKEPFTPKPNQDGMVVNSRTGMNRVLKWIPFASRKIF